MVTDGARAGVAPPQWCEQSKGKVIGVRTAVCRVSGADYNTKQKINGVWRETGRAKLLFISYSYSYSDTGLGTIAHQMEITAINGWVRRPQQGLREGLRQEDRSLQGQPREVSEEAAAAQELLAAR
ncbi:hypothetical protein ACFZCL_41470 [Streptomyces sp. NPDC008159]|uniref:hypothetical protein n=1 Tax=Streptomyces sp. NPDC008159 TaxID=3364817 RepID=UPI0036F0A973